MSENLMKLMVLVWVTHACMVVASLSPPKERSFACEGKRLLSVEMEKLARDATLPNYVRKRYERIASETKEEIILAGCQEGGKFTPMINCERVCERQKDCNEFGYCLHSADSCSIIGRSHAYRQCQEAAPSNWESKA